jgi:serine/threonine-protein kinase
MGQDPAPGSELGAYRLTEQIGQGGMGVVYKGEHTATGQVCALKVLTPELAREEGFRHRFERESAYAGSLDHPNVVSVFEAGEEDGVLYMAMQYVDGTDLKALLAAEGALDPARAVRMLSQVASALDSAHATGLLHRDIKPGNIMIEPGGNPDGSERCYLTDFGLSKNPSSDSFALTAAGSFVGTIDYTAPEQILAKPFDHRVDVYSLGCVLYEALTGDVPFPKARDVEVLYGHIQDPPPRLTEKRPDVPPALDDVIATAMAKDPDDRYQSCTALMDAARAAAGVPDEPTTAPPPSPAGEGEAVLRVVAGKAAGTEIRIAGEFLIGRHAEGDGKLGRDPEISRRHAMIRQDGEKLVIEDLGSTNGTFVNDRRIDAPYELSAGDRIAVGDTVLEVSIPVAGAPPGGATLFAPIPSSTPPAEPAAEVEAPLPPVEEDEVPTPPEAELPPVEEPTPAPAPPEEEPAPAEEEPTPAPAPPPPAAEPAPEPRGKLVLRLEIDLDSGELSVDVEDGGEGRWRIEPA